MLMFLMMLLSLLLTVRLVLSHPLQGGAVAKLVGLRLLREAPEWPPPALRVVCFATPAVGNNALAGLVETAGWGEYFKTYVLPGVFVCFVCVWGGGGRMSSTQVQGMCKMLRYAVSKQAEENTSKRAAWCACGSSLMQLD
jgi:hypothetical protein